MNSEPVQKDVAEAGAIDKQTPSDPNASTDVHNDASSVDVKPREDDSLAHDPSVANCKMPEIKSTAFVSSSDNQLQQPNESLDQQSITEATIPNLGINSASVSSTSNYSSATVTILGDTSDRNDFLPRNQSNNHNIEKEKVAANGVDDRGFISGVKKWFSASDSEDADGPLEHDYHRDVVDNIGSALKAGKAVENERDMNQNRVKSLDDNNYDESLLDRDDDGDVEMGRQRSSTYDEASVRQQNEGGDGKSKFKYTNGGRSKKRNYETKDELRVMGECSFFYDDMGNEENHSPSHKIPGNEQNIANEELNGYYREGHSNKQHRARVVNPRAMAHAISSSARRQWTERRYRRRLKQSTFALPQSMRNDRHQSQQHIEAPQSQIHPELPTYELTTEHRQAFLAAHAALNEQHANEYSRNKHAINIDEYGYDLDIDLDLNLTSDDNQEEEIRADLTKSSLAIRGSGQIRLPIDNVRLVMDSHLQPGILSIESRAGGYMGYENYGNGNRYGNISACEMMPLSVGAEEDGESKNKVIPAHRHVTSEPVAESWRRSELSYVLTVDDRLYQRLFQEISDSYRLPLGMYYCCHVVESEASHDHVGIGVAVSILMVVFIFLVVGMLIWPTD